MSEQDKRKDLEDCLQKSLLKSIQDSSPNELIPVLIPHLFEKHFSNVASQFLLELLGPSPSNELIKNASQHLETFILKLNAFDEFTVTGTVLGLMLQQLVNQTDVSIATKASNALVHLCHIRHEISRDVIFALKEVPVPTDAIVLVRYYSFLCQIVQDWDDNVQILFVSFQKALDNDNDPLLQMSLLEIVENHVRSDKVLNSMRIDPILLKMVGCSKLEEHRSIHDDPQHSMHPFCSGAALRLLARMDPSIVDDNGFVQVLVSYSRHMKGEIEKIGFIDGITTFVSNNDRLKVVTNNNEILEEWLNLRTGQSKFKVVILTSIVRILDKQDISDDLRIRLYHLIGQVNSVGHGNDTTHMIMEYAKSSIIELRLAAYDLLRAVARTKMGSHILVKYGGFLEFLCNFNIELVKEGKEQKYELVKAVAESDVRGLLADKAVAKLDEVLANGPYYHKPVKNVMVE
jgi:hypothetical protein